MNKKGWASQLLLYAIVMLFLFSPFILEFVTTYDWTSLNPNDYARIVSLDYKAVVNDEENGNGKITVTERITFDVHAASRTNGFWELWRDLVENEVDGVKVTYNVLSVKQILDDGTEVVWEESDKLYWDDCDYIDPNYGAGKWYHSEGPYDEDARQYECLLFYVDNVYREQLTFEIEYEMNNAVLRYKDCSDLYISIFSGESCQHLEHFSAEILIPNDKMPAFGNYHAVTYGTSANYFPIEESATKNYGYYTFSMELNDEDLKFKNYNEFLEFELVVYGKDKHIFAQNANRNYYSDYNVLTDIYESQEEYLETAAEWKATKRNVCVVCILCAILLWIFPYISINNWKKKRVYYDTKPYTGTYKGIPSDLDPNFAQKLVFCKDIKSGDDSGVYSALLLSLVRKGYVTIPESSDKDAILNIVTFDNTSAPEGLTEGEREYLSLLQKHARYNSIRMSEFRRRVEKDDYNTWKFVTALESSVSKIGTQENYFQSASWTSLQDMLSLKGTAKIVWGILLTIVVNLISSNTRLDYAFGGFFILGGSLIACGIFSKLHARRYVNLTSLGEQEYRKWRGLYNFLKGDTLMNERTAVELPLWEKYLVYATAFGVSEKVIAAMKIHCPANNIDTNKSVVHNPYFSTGHFHVSSRRFGRAIHTGTRTRQRAIHRASRSYGSYGGSSYSGGYSSGYRGGGGRGGGGGGGGH